MNEGGLQVDVTEMELHKRSCPIISIIEMYSVVQTTDPIQQFR